MDLKKIFENEIKSDMSLISISNKKDNYITWLEKKVTEKHEKCIATQNMLVGFKQNLETMLKILKED
jgi:hypothetical protein